MTANPQAALRMAGSPCGRLLPDGWTMSAKGLWHHENGSRVEHTGRGADYRYLARDCDGVWAYATTRAKAFAWASGEIVEAAE